MSTDYYIRVGRFQTRILLNIFGWRNGQHNGFLKSVFFKADSKKHLSDKMAKKYILSNY